MSRHDANFAASAASSLLHQHGETITYTPRNGAARSITAIVRRVPPQRPDDVPRGTMPRMTIRVLDDADDGVSADEVNTGGDHFTLSYRAGETAEKFYISQLPRGPVGGMLVFEIY